MSETSQNTISGHGIGPYGVLGHGSSNSLERIKRYLSFIHGLDYTIT